MAPPDEGRREAPQADLAQVREAWRQVWGDTVSSIEPGDPAQAHLERWWLHELGGLPDLSQALEIGAGSSAFVSNVVIKHLSGIEVIACDFRDAPSSIPASIQYVGGAAIEALPFPAGRFDVVVSQFAFEYAELDRGVAELARVIRPGGYARLVMHHPESFFAKSLIDRVRCLEAGAALLDSAAVGGSARTLRKLRIRQALRAIDAMIDRYSKPPVPESVLLDLLDFQRIGRKIAAEGRGLEAGDEALLGHCRPALTLAREQIRSTFSPAAIARLMERFGVAGFASAEFDPIQGSTHALGWGVRLHRP